MNMKITIMKYEEYPKESPENYAVGFNIKLENGRSFYMDTLVNILEIKSGMTDEEITILAYEKLKEKIVEKVEKLTYSSPTIIGTEFDTQNPFKGISGDLQKRIDNLDEVVDTIIE